MVFDRFFDIVTDDFYVELEGKVVEKDLRSLLMSSLPLFEFPDRPFTWVVEKELGEKVWYFEQKLTLEEINILATGMSIIWVQRQTHSIEVTRQKFSGSDFKLSSQASQLQRLMRLSIETKDEHRRLQMLHSRRGVDNQGRYKSNFDMFVKEMYPKSAKRRGVSTRPTSD
jgi:hypothetical protein